MTLWWMQGRGEGAIRLSSGNSASGRTTAANDTANKRAPHIEVRDLTMAYGSFVLMHDLNFTVQRGDVFVIMGASGCGKSTLLRDLLGLMEPARGEIFYDGVNFTTATPEARTATV